MVTVIVTAAQELTADQKKKLLVAIEKKYGKVELKIVVDSNVVAGLKVQIGSTEYDASVSGKLAQLRQELMDHVT